MSCRNILALLASFFLPACMAAQASYTATKDITFQAGGAFTIASPDYSNKYIQGIGFYADANLGPHFGIDLQFHANTIVTPLDFGESSAVAGIRYRIVRHRFEPYVRAGGGLGTFTFQDTSTSSHYGLLAGGAGLDYHLMRHVNVRFIDFEYQHWGSFPPNGLTPYVISVGGAYAF
jgi:hypothetical protein